uniref:Transmembrane protein n=1 Tax=Cacopsylla melanoneura TaxID=428564 RepID=A0A8D8LL31_9HEMI
MDFIHETRGEVEGGRHLKGKRGGIFVFNWDVHKMVVGDNFTQQYFFFCFSKLLSTVIDIFPSLCSVPPHSFFPLSLPLFFSAISVCLIFCVCSVCAFNVNICFVIHFSLFFLTVSRVLDFFPPCLL